MGKAETKRRKSTFHEHAMNGWPHGDYWFAHVSHMQPTLPFPFLREERPCTEKQTKIRKNNGKLYL